MAYSQIEKVLSNMNVVASNSEVSLVLYSKTTNSKDSAMLPQPTSPMDDFLKINIPKGGATSSGTLSFEPFSITPITPTEAKPAANSRPKFMWTSNIVIAGATYSLSLFELLDSTDTSKRKTIFEKKGLKVTSLDYPKDAIPLDSNRKYIWGVEAFASNGNSLRTGSWTNLGPIVPIGPVVIPPMYRVKFALDTFYTCIGKDVTINYLQTGLMGETYQGIAYDNAGSPTTLSASCYTPLAPSISQNITIHPCSQLHLGINKFYLIMTPSPGSGGVTASNDYYPFYVRVGLPPCKNKDIIICAGNSANISFTSFLFNQAGSLVYNTASLAIAYDPSNPSHQSWTPTITYPDNTIHDLTVSSFTPLGGGLITGLNIPSSLLTAPGTYKVCYTTILMVRLPALSNGNWNLEYCTQPCCFTITVKPQSDYSGLSVVNNTGWSGTLDNPNVSQCCKKGFLLKNSTNSTINSCPPLTRFYWFIQRNTSSFDCTSTANLPTVPTLPASGGNGSFAGVPAFPIHTNPVNYNCATGVDAATSMNPGQWYQFNNKVDGSFVNAVAPFAPYLPSSTIDYYYVTCYVYTTCGTSAFATCHKFQVTSAAPTPQITWNDIEAPIPLNITTCNSHNLSYKLDLVNSPWGLSNPPICNVA
ncbi:MAG: hypothetical protein NTU43_02430 [Bacteroidetes bacterium]|nr:hypothetical protein [Bacteroidota bacterium]